jgi:hypothetical protein
MTYSAIHAVDFFTGKSLDYRFIKCAEIKTDKKRNSI